MVLWGANHTILTIVWYGCGELFHTIPTIVWYGMVVWVAIPFHTNHSMVWYGTVGSHRLPFVFSSPIVRLFVGIKFLLRPTCDDFFSWFMDRILVWMIFLAFENTPIVVNLSRIFVERCGFTWLCSVQCNAIAQCEWSNTCCSCTTSFCLSHSQGCHPLYYFLLLCH